MKRENQPLLELCAATLLALAGVHSAWGQNLPQNLNAPEADSAIGQEPNVAEPIPWSEIGAAAQAQYQSDGLCIVPTAKGALLRCGFQRLEGEATSEGLWLTSTVPDTVPDRFRLVATALGQQSPGFLSDFEFRTSDLAATGRVTTDGNIVRFTRPGVVEEFSVSMDGVRQDFIIQSPPQLFTSHFSLLTSGELRVDLEVTGARVEPAHYGARLVLENSGRTVAYSRLHVVDATGRELPARMQVASSTPSPQLSTFNPQHLRQ